MQELLAKTTNIAKQAASLAKKYYLDRSFTISHKGHRNLVTEADIAVEEFLKKELSTLVPDARFLAEETANLTSDFTGNVWIVDPIDGTTNFTQGLPHCAVSVALAIDGVVTVAVVVNIFTGETFSALKNHGAFRNGIKLDKVKENPHGLFLLGFLNSEGEKFEENFILMRKLKTHVHEFRRLGAASLDICYVACGIAVAYLESVRPWDIAAGALVARECGCLVGTYREDPLNNALPSDLISFSFLVAHPQKYELILKALSS